MGASEYCSITGFIVVFRPHPRTRHMDGLPAIGTISTGDIKGRFRDGVFIGETNGTFLIGFGASEFCDRILLTGIPRIHFIFGKERGGDFLQNALVPFAFLIGSPMRLDIGLPIINSLS